jgi:uncharacterized alpha-E superfamily protein
MLLSSVAEAMLWTGRYVERSRALARTVLAYERLSLDLPETRSADLRPLMRVIGREQPAGAEAASTTSESLQALVLDAENPSSVLGALGRARENLRRGRVDVPPEVWATMNALYLRLSEVKVARMADVLTVLEEVVAAGSRIEGELTAGMMRDDAYSFLRIGEHLERGDMLLRTMDALVSAIDPRGPERLFDDVRWMGLLQAVAAQSMYRRRHHTHVDLPTVLEFLALDAAFPRSLSHCLAVIAEELQKLPRAEEAQAAHTISVREVTALADSSAAGLRSQVSRVLFALATLQRALKVSYFPEEPRADAHREPAATPRARSEGSTASLPPGAVQAAVGR